MASQKKSGVLVQIRVQECNLLVYRRKISFTRRKFFNRFGALFNII